MIIICYHVLFLSPSCSLSVVLNPYLFETVIFRRPRVSVAVDGDFHCGSFAHDAVRHGGPSQRTSATCRSMQMISFG